MENIDNLVEEWNRQLYLNNDKIEKDYNDLFFNLNTLVDFKFEPYQPIISPPQKKFFERLYEWLSQFEENEKNYLFYLVSKILFFNQNQINHLCVYIYERCIKKIILRLMIVELKFPKHMIFLS